MPADPAAAPEFPRSVTGLQNLDAILGNLEAAGIRFREETVCIDPHSSLHRGNNFAIGVCPPLTRTACGAGGFGGSTHRRFMLTKEMFKLQGVPLGRIKYSQVSCRVKKNGGKTSMRRVSERQMRLAIGNAMSVPVVGRVMFSVLRLLGYIASSLPDPWLADGACVSEQRG